MYEHLQVGNEENDTQRVFIAIFLHVVLIPYNNNRNLTHDERLYFTNLFLSK